MRKRDKNIFLKHVNNSETPSPSFYPERKSPSSCMFQSKNNNTLLKAGIYAINSEKKYSVLSVPRISSRFFKICKENKTPDSFRSETYPTESSTPTVYTPRIEKNSLPKGITQSFTVRHSILSSNRFRKNPNQENLQNALQEIEKKTEKINDKQNSRENNNKNTENTEKKIKSDIENLIESQKLSYLNTNKKRFNRLEIKEITTQRLRQKSIDSQRSDPSPVRRKKQIEKIERCHTSQRMLLSKKKMKKKEDQKIIYRAGKIKENWLSKYMKQNISSSSSDDTSSEIGDLVRKFDYNLESMKILKDTSSFANKIMKGIRYSQNRKH